jgi:hypothetical protein
MSFELAKIMRRNGRSDSLASFREVAAVGEASTEPSLTMDSDWYFRQEQFESLRRDYLDADRALRDHGQYTDRQLRELNKERKAISSELWHEYRFVAEADSFGSDTPPPRVLTRKDKRQMKTERRRGGRYLKQLGFLT